MGVMEDSDLPLYGAVGGGLLGAVVGAMHSPRAVPILALVGGFTGMFMGALIATPPRRK